MKINKIIVFFSIVFIALALLTTYLVAKKNAQANLQAQIKTQLQQVVNKVEITLKRHAYLPALLSSEKEIRDFVIRNNAKPLRFIEGSPEQRKMNLILERNNHISETSNIYIMRLDGTTIASSNWESKHSFIGKNFSFRPYFQQASHNILGRYYAVGSVSGKRGYFFASSIIDNEKVVGVIAVKVALEEIEFTWGTGAVDFMITDASGVIFLSSQKDWNLHSLKPLSQESSDLFLQTRRYGLNKITALDNTTVDLDATDFQTIKLLDKKYEMLSKRMGLVDWHVRVIASHSNMKKSIVTALLISALILTLLSALTALLWKNQRQQKRYQQQIRIELENKVVKRTKALKQTQEDLIQAAKMAALGQLSAGITHEINNPLTAIRAYADNARQFLEKERFDMVESNLAEISSLTESMASITRQLKSFARKSKGQTTPVLLGTAISRSLLIVRPKLLSRSIICHWNEQQHGANKSVLADEVWLGQILVNLLTNAISATNEQAQAEIWITIAAKENNQLCIHVKDNGSGIGENTLPHIFEPFFTTKPSSKGLGLGLSISFNLAKDMNGSLGAHNLDNGAQFTLCLPRVK